MTSSSPNDDCYAKARQLIDQVHAQDPASLEMGYADDMERWVVALDPEAEEDQVLRLAARCQHLNRFDTPRSTYPEGKAGYLKWRRDLYTIQANLASSLLLSASVPEAEAASVARWVSKDNLHLASSSNPEKAAKVEKGTILLEDAAVLVFLEKEIVGFVGKNEGYTREKWVGIVGKTWKKLSRRGQEAALTLVPQLPQELQDIVTDAVAGAS